VLYALFKRALRGERHGGQADLAVTQAQLIREVWGPERLGDTRSLRVCMKNLRAKLEADPKRPEHCIDFNDLYPLNSPRSEQFSPLGSCSYLIYPSY
jgi:hypothetical protein